MRSGNLLNNATGGAVLRIASIEPDERMDAHRLADWLGCIPSTLRLASDEFSSCNQTHAHLARAAQQLDIPLYQLQRGGEQCLPLGQGHRLRLCHDTLTDRTPLFARAATNKEALHDLLQRRGMPLPAQGSADSLEQALAATARRVSHINLRPASSSRCQIRPEPSDCSGSAWENGA